jgi:hypothetical protein
MGNYAEDMRAMPAIDIAMRHVLAQGEANGGLEALLQAKIGAEAAEVQLQTANQITLATNRLATYTKVLVVVGILQAIVVLLAALIARS